MRVILQADRRPKQNHRNEILPAHPQEPYLLRKDFGPMLNQKNNRYPIIQCRRNWSIFFVMEAYPENKALKIAYDSGQSNGRVATSSFWAFCSSRLAFFLKWEFWMILFRAEATFASSISKFGKFLPASDRENFDSSTESTISTSLIHTMASEGKSEQGVTWFLNRIFQTKNDDGVVSLSNCSSDVCCLCCPTIELWNLHWHKGIHGRRPACKCRH